MNVENLRETYQHLLTHMQMAGYKESTIANYRREIMKILENAQLKQWTSYKDVYQEYSDHGCSYYRLRGKRAMLGTLERFDLYGICPDGHHHYPFITKGAYAHLTLNFKAFVDYYKEAETKRRPQSTTPAKNSIAISTFFLALQNMGCPSLEAATEEQVLSVFYSEAEGVLKSHDYRHRIEVVLKVCMDMDLVLCKRILNYIPEIHAYRKNLPVFTDVEIKKIKAELKAPDSRLTLRDKAIGTLALYTGLRSGDIIHLKLSSINWKEECIRLHQQKTGVPLTLPLSALVGNAIYDYLTNERPRIDDPHVFLTSDVPYRSMKTVHQVSRHIFREAEIRQEPGSRKGLHLFRHHMATRLLENEIPQPVISKAMGHTSPHSLNPYLHIDFSHLKECSISITDFPLRKEVFSV